MKYAERVDREAAHAIAHETMQRVRHNIEILIPRLPILGYQFGECIEEPLPHWFQEDLSPEGERVFLPYVPPDPETYHFLEQLKQTIGPLPLSLEAFYREVGGVNFIGTHPRWDKLVDATACQEHRAIERLDPLSIDPLTLDGVQFFLNEYSWYREAPADWAEEPFGLELAPASYHKYGISGGAPYAMAVPDASIDGLLLHEWHETTFVDYLRICFRLPWQRSLPQRTEASMPGFDGRSLLSLFLRGF